MEFTEDQFQKWCHLAGLRPKAKDAESLRKDLQRIFNLTKDMDHPPDSDVKPMISPAEAHQGVLRNDDPGERENLKFESKIQNRQGQHYFVMQKKNSKKTDQ